MKRVCQHSFKSRHYHPSTHTRGAFRVGNYHLCGWSLPSCQNTESW